jgi:metallo-beta-lactamase family protein
MFISPLFVGVIFCIGIQRKMVKIIAKRKDKITISFVDSPSAEDVTGSMIYIKTPSHQILVDAGLHQTNDKYKDFLVNNRKFKEFKIKDIDYIFITHNHLDHNMLVPKLVKDGFIGKIIVPENSKEMFQIMANDCAFINERDIEVINKQHGKKYSPLFTEDDVKKLLDYIYEYQIGDSEKYIIDNEFQFEFIPSGHLLNSCQILLYLTVDNVTRTILVTGDIGNKIVDNRFVGKFIPISKCDAVIGESTYGDRPDLKVSNKERENDLLKLKTIIETQVIENKGKLLIPTFAQSRCQQLAYIIYQICNKYNYDVPVYIDSPLSIKIFKEYENILQDEDKSDFDNLINWDNLIFAEDPEDSKALISSDKPCIILSSSGFCTAGRVRHHLKALVGNPNTTILFVGYSSEGSLASILKNNKTKTVTIDTKIYPVKCATYSLKSFSGHAPFDQLLAYYSSINCNRLILHHGSKLAKETLKTVLENKYADMCKTTKISIANSSLKINIK